MDTLNPTNCASKNGQRVFADPRSGCCSNVVFEDILGADIKINMRPRNVDLKQLVTSFPLWKIDLLAPMAHSGPSFMSLVGLCTDHVCYRQTDRQTTDSMFAILQ